MSPQRGSDNPYEALMYIASNKSLNVEELQDRSLRKAGLASPALRTSLVEAMRMKVTHSNHKVPCLNSIHVLRYTQAIHTVHNPALEVPAIVREGQNLDLVNCSKTCVRMSNKLEEPRVNA